MSNRSNPAPEPTEAQKQRMQNIWQAMSECFHFIETDEQASMKGLSKEEHARRHAVWAWGVMVGMEYTATYPKRALKMIQDKKLGGDSETILVDAMAEALLPLFPSPKPNQNKVLELRDSYTELPANVLGIKPVFTADGKLYWEETDTHPFDWEFELETWEDSSE